ncbi:kynurenine aminotransferase-like isoform X2 [Chrysoperla carnea]|uniref:kynurenine aminotransferase-like isoform X2 n=1 Tax=Chrysoperla carnea TaxID=189513 RepID=UPI001D05FFAA|nr:kynurenine aminotransferase-like isoform X2 [Chrysoperla carnea]
MIYFHFNKFLHHSVASIWKISLIKSSSFTKNINNKFHLSKKYQSQGKNVWLEYSNLDAEYKPVNLGPGVPDFAPCDFITNALKDVACGENKFHQYAREYGHLNLVKILTKLYTRLIGHQIDLNNEIVITVGAYEALHAAILGHVHKNDEVIIIEPFFDCYAPMVRLAGGIPKFIPLKPTKTSGIIHGSDWVLDNNELESLFNEKTKMIILNTPHNPMGKVFTINELQVIADLCQKWNVLCLSDEVYEWLIYEPYKHVRIASLPGMWEHTLTIGSAGKTFGVTGWRIGWVYGPANLMSNLRAVHQQCVFQNNTPCQEAVARVLETECNRFGSKDSYFVTMPQQFKEKRDYFIKVLSDIGMIPTVPDGGYSIIADWSPLESQIDLTSEKDTYKDYRFTKWMVKHVKLLGIPPSAFYSTEHKSMAGNYIRNQKH